MNDWKNKKVAVLGLGVEGFSSARYLVSKNAQVSTLDEKEEKDIDPHMLQEIKALGVKTVFGKDAFNNLVSYKIAIRSPGIRRFTSLLDNAAKKGVEVTSQIKLFFDLCPCPIIGVTGTKGKGTTSSLIYEMLKKDGRDAYLGGNIGLPPLDFLEKLKQDSIVVLELSSYQLQDIHKSPHIAVMLMVTNEHLVPDRVGSIQNYHPDINDYVQAKRNIIRYQTQDDFAVISRDYPASLESDVYTEGKIFQVSREREVVTQGCFVRGEAVWVLQNGQEKKIIETDQILLPGKHNLENVCAAVMAATLAGVSTKSIVSVLQTFKGLEHRLEFVATVGGVRYYNDSFSTTPETAIAAIQSFEDPQVLILGGSSKQSDFTQLGLVICDAKNIKAIIGIGAEWERIKKSIKYYVSSIKYIEGCRNMKEIAQAAFEAAKPGDVVLLSPACASFDMFKNYKDRGAQFKKEVQRLQQSHST